MAAPWIFGRSSYNSARERAIVSQGDSVFTQGAIERYSGVITDGDALPDGFDPLAKARGRQLNGTFYPPHPRRVLIIIIYTTTIQIALIL